MIRVHELMCPEVFISFHWGIALGENYTGPFSGHPRARFIRDMLRKELDVFTFIDTTGHGEGDPGEHVKATFAAIKGCSVFVCLLSDAYVNSSRCRREFERAVGTSKYIIPVLLPIERDIEGDLMKCLDGHTGWMGKETGPDWWKHALSISDDAMDDTQVRWSVLQHFQPINMLYEGLKYDGERTSEHMEHDIIFRVEDRMFAGEHVKHDTKRVYKAWQDARAVLFAQLRAAGTGLDAAEDERLSDLKKAELRAARVFALLDVDGNGVIEKDELKEGFAKLGIGVDDGIVAEMLSEADVDGNVGIDCEEFVDAILKVTLEEGLEKRGKSSRRRSPKTD